MDNYSFILTPGLWLGEGKITFSTSPTFIKFYTKWQIVHESPQLIRAIQLIELQGEADQVANNLIFSNITANTFQIDLKSNLIGQAVGTGLYDDRVIAWEFVGNTDFEGFESYERQENGDYFFHAEYGSSHDFHTVVEGLIWRKNN